MRGASDRRDGQALERAAHKLKGSVGNFGAHEAFDGALRLEAMGREADFAHSDETCTKLRRMLSTSGRR